MVEDASRVKDQTRIPILTQLPSFQGKLFTPLSVSCPICERGIITLLLSEATVRVMSSPLGPSGSPTSINGATPFMQLLGPKVWMSSMAPLPLEYWLQSISESWWLHLQTVSGTQPLLTSPISVLNPGGIAKASPSGVSGLPFWPLRNYHCAPGQRGT